MSFVQSLVVQGFSFPTCSNITQAFHLALHFIFLSLSEITHTLLLFNPAVHSRFKTKEQFLYILSYASVVTF